MPNCCHWYTWTFNLFKVELFSFPSSIYKMHWSCKSGTCETKKWKLDNKKKQYTDFQEVQQRIESRRLSFVQEDSHATWASNYETNLHQRTLQLQRFQDNHFANWPSLQNLRFLPCMHCPTNMKNPRATKLYDKFSIALNFMNVHNIHERSVMNENTSFSGIW